MTADPVGDDVLTRLADALAVEFRDDDLNNSPATRMKVALFAMDLAVVPRAQTVKTDGSPAGWMRWPA